MAEDQGRQPPTVLLRKTADPLRAVQDTLDHQRIDVHQADLNQMERQHADFLLVQLIGGKFVTLTKANEIVDIVPVFDHV